MPDNNEINEYKNFMLDLEAQARAEEEFLEHTFFTTYKNVTLEAGYTEEVEHTPYRAQGLQVDGFYCDIDGTIKDILGNLTIVINDFRSEKDKVESLNTDHIKSLFKRVENFFLKCKQESFFKGISETEDAYPLVFNIFKYHKSIKKVRVYIFSNARLATRMKRLETKVIEGIPFAYNIFDFEEYLKLTNAKAGRTEIEIVFDDYAYNNIPLLEAGINSDEYSSMLFALPCDVLANIYDEYKAQLLEQNVRTFLQARGEVNKGIINTLKNYPERFFAYNNGITATASNIEIEKNKKTGLAIIKKIKNLQIVNGGQTTASCLYAREQDKANLSKAFVQVKLSIVNNDDLVEEIVPLISKFANTQNKVNKADFFANHEFHRRIAEYSMKTIVPAAEGEFAGSKWYYESKRGSYKDMMSYKTPAEIKKLKLEYPPEKKIDKTEFAKHILSFAKQPYDVAKGAQYAFITFAKHITETWDKNNTKYSKTWYKEAISKSIFFKGVDDIIKKSEWDFKSGGNKAVLTTYSIAWLTNYLEDKKLYFNFDKIWQDQQIGDDIKSIFLSIIPSIYQKMNADAERTLPQQAKTKVTWDRLKAAMFILNKELIESVTIGREEATMAQVQGQNQQQLYNDVEIQIKVTELAIAGEWSKIEAFAINNTLMNHNYNDILNKIRRGRNLTSTQSRNIIKLYNRCLEIGYKNE